MLELALATVLLALLAPHLLPLQRVAPATAGAVWLGALALRSALCLYAAVLMLTWLPRTAGFDWLARGTWHQIVPATPHVDLRGDPVAHTLALAPALLLALSMLGFLVAAVLTAFRVRRKLRRATVGGGPEGSVVVADHRVFIAVTGLGRHQVLVSDAALAEMDEEELAVSLAHELGHVRRFHRPLVFVAALLGRVGRPLPGTRASERSLRFSLERDADEYAIRAGDPLALASAICKAAAGPARTPEGALALAGETSTAIRLDQLLGEAPKRSGALLEGGALLLAGLLSALTVVCASLLLAWLSPGGLSLAIACSA